MVRFGWIIGLAAALAQARDMRRIAVSYHQTPDLSGDSKVLISITTDKLLATSPLLQNPGIHQRVPIDIVVTNITSVAATGNLVFAANSRPGLYDWVALKITASSDANSCALVYGTDFDGETWEGYAYQTITKGLDCDTITSYETVRVAVGTCADKLHDAHALRGCCRFNYGETWIGQLRLTAEADGCISGLLREMVAVPKNGLCLIMGGASG
jgi:hypothetical protein